MLKAIFRTIFPLQSKAEMAIASALNVKPSLVGEMLAAMGSERGQIFLSHLQFHDFKEIGDAIFTFYVFRIYVKNSHPNEIRWWRDRMLEKGFDINFTEEKADIVSSYLKDAGVDYISLHRFAREYNNTFVDTSSK
jgi:hypothetical protein